jgi:DNA-binding NtrC family response regulator
MATDRAAAQRAGDVPPVIPATILVVDDDRELLRVLERTLRGAGYTVVARADAESGLAHVKESAPDLVITDLMLPGRDGLEFLADIKAIAPQVGVLLITAHASLERAVEAMRNGAHDFLEKPFERSRLLLTVQRALEKQVLTAENRRLKERLKDHEALDRMVGASRKEDLQKVPGVAETLDWAATLAGLDVHELRHEPERVHETMICLGCPGAAPAR